MIREKQVSNNHYHFSRYVSKQRWASMWHQLDEVLRIRPCSVLEVGPGPGIFKAVANLVGVKVDTLDIDPELAPDFIASADCMPFEAATYDVVCAFQMLEHVPFNVSLAVVSEMSRVATSHVVVSLPDARPRWRYSIYVPKIGQLEFVISRPCFRPKPHLFDGEHYWEIHKEGFQLKHIVAKFEEAGRMTLMKSFEVPEFLYHRLFVFELNE
jgi:hypothetical protein